MEEVKENTWKLKKFEVEFKRGWTHEKDCR